MILYRLTLFLPLFAQCQASEYSDVYPVEEFGEEEEGRVHFGQDASKGQYPFVVSIQQKAGKNDWAHFCGGTILTASIILTAGHCLKGKKAKNIKVYVGQVDISKTNKKYLYSAKKLIIHKSFNLKKIATTANDIGLIKLASKIDFDKVDTAYQVCLPTEDDVPDVQNCVALGWGRDESNERQTTLQHAKFKILSAADCKKKKGSDYNDKLLFCATGKKKGGATCLGDSGGPIVCGLVDYPKYYLQFGIVSFGATDCKEFPGFYTKVKKFISWIQKNGS